MGPSDTRNFHNVLILTCRDDSFCPSSCLPEENVYTKSWKLTKQLKATSEFLLDKMVAMGEETAAAEAAGTGVDAKGQAPGSRPEKEDMARLDEMPWIPGLEGKVERVSVCAVELVSERRGSGWINQSLAVFLCCLCVQNLKSCVFTYVTEKQLDVCAQHPSVLNL